MRRLGPLLLLLLVAAAGIFWLLSTRGIGVEPVVAPDADDASATSPDALAGRTRTEPEAARGDGVPAPATVIAPSLVAGAVGVAAPSVLAANPAGAFSGVVIDAKDQPIAKASVRLAVALGEKGGVDATATAAVTTGSDGRFSIVAPKGAREGRVNARAAGYSPARPDVHVSVGADATIVMVAACVIRVRVVREGIDTGVPGVRVLSFGGTNPEWAVWAQQAEAVLALDEGTTDTSGFVTLSSPGGKTGLLAIAEDGSVGRVESLLVPPAGVEATVALRPVGGIDGVVVDPEGRPVADALVHAGGVAGFSRDTKTGADGTFALEGVPSNDFLVRTEAVQVAVTAKDWPTRRVACVQPQAGRRERLRITLSAWRRVEGRVVRADGTPALGAVVVASDGPAAPEEAPRERERGVATSGADGSFSIGEAPEPTFYLSATLDGKEGRSTGSLMIARAPAEGDEPPTIRLSAPTPTSRGELRIRVVDAAGNAVVQTLVEAGVMHDANGMLGTFGSSTTDDEGRAAISNVAAGRILVVVHPKTAPTVAIALGAADGTEEREIRLPGGVVSGRVVHLDGTPAEIGLRLELKLRSAGGVETQFGGWGRTRSDRDGNFRWEGVGDGRYALVPDAPTDVWVGAVPEVAAGETHLRLVVATAADEAALHLEAEWLDADTNRPIPAARGIALVFDPAVGRDLHVVSFGQAQPGSGLWVSDGSLVPGTYNGAVDVTGYKSLNFTGARVPDGARPYRLRQRLVPAGRIEGTVQGKDGAALPGRVEVGVSDRSTTVRPDGSFSLAVPVEGSAEVSVFGDHVRRASQSVVVPAEGAARVEFTVESAGAILVRIAGGVEPKERLWLTLRRLDPQLRDGPITLMEFDRAWLARHIPSTTLPGLATGTYRASALWDGKALPDVVVEVRDGETAILDLHAP